MQQPQFDINPDARLILIHPRLRGGSLLANLITTPNTYYHCFSDDALSLSSATQQLQSSYKRKTLATRLILDECDRLQPNALTALIEALYGDFEPRQLVIISRRLPAAIYNNPAWLPYTQIITPHEPDFTLSPTPLIEAFGFGAGKILLNGTPIHFESEEQCEFIFFTLENAPLHPDDMIAALPYFQTVAPKEGTSTFHNLRRKIDDIIGMPWLVPAGLLYTINPMLTVCYDVQRYRSLSIPTQPDIALYTLYEHAYALASHPFLMTTQSTWVQSTRNTLQQYQADVCDELGKYHANQGNTAQAIGYFTRALYYAPTRHTITQQLMELYSAQSHPYDAVTAFNALQHHRRRDTITIKLPSDLIELAKSVAQKCPERTLFL